MPKKEFKITKEYLIKCFLGHIESNWIQKEAIKVLNKKGKAETIKFLKSHKNWGSSTPNLVGHIMGENEGVVHMNGDREVVLVATWNDIIKYLEPDLRRINKLGAQGQLI